MLGHTGPYGYFGPHPSNTWVSKTQPFTGVKLQVYVTHAEALWKKNHTSYAWFLCKLNSFGTSKIVVDSHTAKM